jgi:carboxyl-terminal processing protease
MKIRMLLTAALLLFNTSLFAVESEPPDSTREAAYRVMATQIKLFGEIYRRVNQQYVDPVDPKAFIEAAIDGMLETLDPYTVYFQPDDMGELEVITQGEYGGIGIEIALRGENKELTVVSPIDDTPAARKGIRSGDAITFINGKSTRGFTTSDAAKLIRGPEGTEVTITIRRVGYGEPLEYTLKREAIRVHDVSYAGMLENSLIGYIKLSRFSGKAGEELASALKDLMAKKPGGIILDLRSNPGGLLPSAVEVAQQFLKPGMEIVSTRSRTGKMDRAFTAGGEPLAVDVPLVLLINGGSASASEIVAGAIQDHDRGVIIGTSSFGKGLVQSVMNLPGGAALKITTARYYTPSGRLIQKDRKKEDAEQAELAADMEMEPAARDTAASDSVAPKYSTDNGRQVFGGGGITPDIALEAMRLDPVVVEMYRRDLFFDFAQNWLNSRERPASFLISDEMFSRYVDFLKEKNFEPPVEGTKELGELRVIGKRDSLEGKYFDEIAALESELRARFDPTVSPIREEVRRALAMELASALGGLTWRVRASFEGDPQLGEAVSVLNNGARYSAILSGTERAMAPIKE